MGGRGDDARRPERVPAHRSAHSLIMLAAEDDDAVLVPGRSAGGSRDCGGGQTEVAVFVLCAPAGDGSADGSADGSVDGNRELPGDGTRLCAGEYPCGITAEDGDRDVRRGSPAGDIDTADALPG